jgi:glycosyltransferase involved in cell wall biosynthesis
MRILMANYRYFVSGGPERYLFAVQEGLQARGHEVIPFSIRYPQNEPSKYESYFVPPLADPDQVRFRDHSWTPKSLFKTLERSVYSPEVERAVRKLIRETQPDVAYVMHFLKKLSPSLLVGIKKEGKPIVARLSDMLLICPEAHFMRDGEICTACTRGSLWPSVRYKCVQGSRMASLVHYLASRYHERRRFFDRIDKFVVPTEHTVEWMSRSGWPREKFCVIPTFVADGFFHGDGDSGGSRRYLLYVGHLEAHKGVDVLVKAYAKAAARKELPPLEIAGGLSSPFSRYCQGLVHDLGLQAKVHFLDFVRDDALVKLYRGALFTVVPSRCYENLPNVLLESYASGTPVLGSGHGSIGPLIQEGVTGATFHPGDVDDLADKIGRWVDDPEGCRRAGMAARDYAEKESRLAKHLDSLTRVLEEARASQGVR